MRLAFITVLALLDHVSAFSYASPLLSELLNFMISERHLKKADGAKQDCERQKISQTPTGRKNTGLLTDFTAHTHQSISGYSYRHNGKLDMCLLSITPLCPLRDHQLLHPVATNKQPQNPIRFIYKHRDQHLQRITDLSFKVIIRFSSHKPSVLCCLQ